MPTRIVKLENVNSLSGKSFIQYDATENEFKLVDANDVLSTSAEDGDVSDAFVDQVEEQISIENLQLLDVDGGSF
jgi:hypothetical protein